MTDQEPVVQPKLTETPATRAGQVSFLALVVVAILVALVTSSIPAAVAVLAVGGLILGGVLLIRGRRTTR
ncbi:MAG: hypothetical protein JSU06_19735 [Actinobacteria bacterium]|nr:hypothetical protein [Actinomycetota bacterium]